MTRRLALRFNGIEQRPRIAIDDGLDTVIERQIGAGEQSHGDGVDAAHIDAEHGIDRRLESLAFGILTGREQCVDGERGATAPLTGGAVVVIGQLGGGIDVGFPVNSTFALAV